MRHNKVDRILIGIAVIFGFALFAAWKGSEHEVTARVTRCERVTKKDSSAYMVFTTEGTFKVTDSLLLLRWDSSDVYAGIEEGQTYRFSVIGWRVPFLSWYPNIERAEQLK